MNTEKCPRAAALWTWPDHAEPMLKTAEIGVVFRRGVSWRRIKSEVDQCLVRCANCHQRRTARQFGWYRLEAAALAPVAQLDRASVFGTEGLQVRSLSGAPLYSRECQAALWRSACDLVNVRAVASALMATCLVLAVALWPSKVVRAAPVDDCIAGLPADLATQLQPLIQALCEASQSGASGLDLPSQ